MEIEVGRDMRIKGANREFLIWVHQNFVLDNPDYYKKKTRGLYVGDTPRQLVLFEKVGQEIVLPFGALQDVYRRYPEASYNAEFSPLRRFNYDSHIKPYDYQETAIQAALRRKNGVLVMPCGAGKTSCGLEIISRVSGRALWLTHTQDLLNQSKERAYSFLDCDKSAFGTITGGKVNISDGITFATVQTLWRLDLDKYRDTWDIIIVDECHHAAGSPTKVTQFYKVLTNLCARYKIGLTATPHRADGLEKCMYLTLGNIIHEVPKEAVAEKTCPVRVEMRNTGYIPNPDDVTGFDGTLDYHALVADLVGNVPRFRLILSDVQKIAKDNPVLVLANRVEYLSRISEHLNHAGIKSICLSKLGASKKAKEERKNALRALNDGEINCICATYQLSKEGLDIPNLRYIVMASPEKDYTTVVQSAGRVGRKADGKAFGTVIDYVDDFGMYRSWSKKRIAMYKKLDYDII